MVVSQVTQESIDPRARRRSGRDVVTIRSDLHQIVKERYTVLGNLNASSQETESESPRDLNGETQKIFGPAPPNKLVNRSS